MMLVELEEETSDFKQPSLKIIATTLPEAFELGELFHQAKLFGLEGVRSVLNKDVWIRVPIVRETK